MIKTVAINKDFEIIKNIEIEKLMNGDFLWYWIDIDRPNQDEIQLLESPFRFSSASNRGLYERNTKSLN